MNKPARLPYGIAFDTKKHSDQSYIEFTEVILKKSILGLDEKVSVALRDDPLYAQLERYVRDNPTDAEVSKDDFIAAQRSAIVSLFSTLDTIKGLAQKGRNKEIVRMLDDLDTMRKGTLQ